MAERYEITRKIGSGGVGAVYEALDTFLGRKVAIKRLLPADDSESPDLSRGSLQKETAALSALQHPNIVTIFDVGEDEDGQFVVMELIEGENIEEMVARETFDLEPFLVFASQTLDALAAAQSLNLLHRDIKPRNLMVRWQTDGKPLGKILDFGLAKFAPKPALQTMDHNKAVLGSVFYMAPEQFERRPLDRRTDIYSLGSVFYYALSGQDPFDGTTAVEVMNAHLEHRLYHLKHYRPDIPEPLADWVMWMMNRKMEDRPAGAEEALAVLYDLQRTSGTVAETLAKSVVQVGSGNVIQGTRQTPGTRTLRLVGAKGSRGMDRALLSSATGAVMERNATTGLVPDVRNGQLTRPPGRFPASYGRPATGAGSAKQATAGTRTATSSVAAAQQKAGRGLLWFGIGATGIALAAVAAVLFASLGGKGEAPEPESGTVDSDGGAAANVVAAPRGTPEWNGGAGADVFAEKNWRGGKVPKPGGEGLLPRGLNRSLQRMDIALNFTVAGKLEVEGFYDVIGSGTKPGILKVEPGGEVTIGTKGKSKLVIGRKTSGAAEVRGKLSVASDLEIGDTEGTVARLTVEGGEVSAPKLRGGNCEWDFGISKNGKVTISGEADFTKGKGRIKISENGVLRAEKLAGAPRPEVTISIESGGRIKLAGAEAESLFRSWIEGGKVLSPKPPTVKKIDEKGKIYFELTAP